MVQVLLQQMTAGYWVHPFRGVNADMFSFLKKMTNPSSGTTDNSEFRVKYNSFRELLERNNEVLETH